MPVPSFAFVSVFVWPEGWSREQMVDAIARCVGIDPADAALCVAKPAPLAIVRMEERPAGAAVRSLRDLGVQAFAPTLKQLNGLPGPILAKRLVPVRSATTAYRVEPWRGPSVDIAMTDVHLIIRAAVISRRSTEGDPTTKVRYDTETGIMHLDRIKEPSKRTSLAEVIELHAADGQRIRIDGNKFSFDVLGDKRQLADAVNANLLAERLVVQASRARLELGFPQFAAPVGAVRALDAGATLARSRMPEFDFYSAWLHILHRLALGS